MEITDLDPDDFLADHEDEVSNTLRRLDELAVAAMPGRRRVMWEGVFWGGTEQRIVGYGDLRQPRPKSQVVEWFLVGLARQKTGYSLYVNAVRDGAYLGQAYADRLTAEGGRKVKIGSASIGFRSIDDVDLDTLSELLREAHSLTDPDPDPDPS